ncbi:F-box protein 6 [Sarotherodon galilaeus]
MVLEQVRRQEEAARRARAVALAKQGRWINWESVEKRKLSWSEIWGMESNRLAETVEYKRESINAQAFRNQEEHQYPSAFVWDGDKPRTSPSTLDVGPLKDARDWQMQVDLDQRLIFPTEIITTTLRPDLLWEDATEETFECQKLRCANLAAEAEDRGWKIRVRLVEVGCRGFVGSTIAKLLREIGVRGQEQRQAIRELANTAERTNHWL